MQHMATKTDMETDKKHLRPSTVSTQYGGVILAPQIQTTLTKLLALDVSRTYLLECYTMFENTCSRTCPNITRTCHEHTNMLTNTRSTNTHALRARIYEHGPTMTGPPHHGVATAWVPLPSKSTQHITRTTSNSPPNAALTQAVATP